MTTDTRPKLASASFSFRKIDSENLRGGQGRRHDSPSTGNHVGLSLYRHVSYARRIKAMLADACEQTFNCISIDGDTSTNDTVLAARERSLRSPTERTVGAARIFLCTAWRFVGHWPSKSSGMAKALSTSSALSVEQAQESGGPPGSGNGGSFAAGEDSMGRRRSKLGTHSCRSRPVRHRAESGQSVDPDR